MRGAVKLEEIHITWQDGLPDDDRKRRKLKCTRYTAGLTSRESALRRLYGLEGEALQEEIDRINSEQAGRERWRDCRLLRCRQRRAKAARVRAVKNNAGSR
jgi:hypothetical protein